MAAVDLSAGGLFFGRNSNWDGDGRASLHEPDLFRLGYAFEQATHHRRPPAAAPAL
jgi:hypothetical protein